MSGRSIDLEDLKRLSNGDSGFYTEMLSIFIKTTEQEISSMTEAMRDKNWKKVSDSAHKIIPPTIHIGAMKFHSELREIEKEARDQTHVEKLPELISEVEKESQRVISEVQAELDKLKKTT